MREREERPCDSTEGSRGAQPTKRPQDLDIPPVQGAHQRPLLEPPQPRNRKQVKRTPWAVQPQETPHGAGRTSESLTRVRGHQRVMVLEAKLRGRLFGSNKTLFTKRSPKLPRTLVLQAGSSFWSGSKVQCYSFLGSVELRLSV